MTNIENDRAMLATTKAEISTSISSISRVASYVESDLNTIQRGVNTIVGICERTLDCVVTLQKENKELKQEVKVLKAENKELKQEVHTLKNKSKEVDVLYSFSNLFSKKFTEKIFPVFKLKIQQDSDISNDLKSLLVSPVYRNKPMDISVVCSYIVFNSDPTTSYDIFPISYRCTEQKINKISNMKGWNKVKLALETSIDDIAGISYDIFYQALSIQCFRNSDAHKIETALLTEGEIECVSNQKDKTTILSFLRSPMFQ